MKIKYGADPEAFSTYILNDEEYCLPPVEFRLHYGAKVKKNGRHPIFYENSLGFVHEDGAAFEFGLKEPDDSLEQTRKKILALMDEFNEYVLSLYGESTGKLKFYPTVNYDPNRWVKKGPEYVFANRFGCDRDSDIFTTLEFEPEEDATFHKYRYGGGHIHISGPNLYENPRPAIISLAFTVGLASVAYSDVPEKEHLRWYRYGKPGRFRLQKYPDGTTGIEYRSPSNRWVINDALFEKINYYLKVGLEIFYNKKFIRLEGAVDSMVEAMRNTDTEKAKELLSFVESLV